MDYMEKSRRENRNVLTAMFAAVPAFIFLLGWIFGGLGAAFGWLLMYYATVVIGGLIFGICSLG